MVVRRKTARTLHRPYTTGELNKTVDDLCHPLAEIDPTFLIIDGLLHGIIEQNPPESILKFIHYNLAHFNRLAVPERHLRSGMCIWLEYRFHALKIQEDIKSFFPVIELEGMRYQDFS